MNEFDLIRRHFDRPTRRALLGVGDDCAIVAPAAGQELLLSTDMLVSGRHFLPEVDPVALGHKTLAVNLSDIAAMGGTPRWALLSAAIPAIDEDWITGFARGFFSLADRFDLDIIGGDTTRGPLTLNVTIAGEAPPGTAIRRDGARPGDDIWVSGELGLAAAAVQAAQGALPEIPAEVLAQCHARLDWPEPRVTLGLALRGVASAMLDVSDGLLGDLAHILERSACAATVELEALPTHPWLAARRRELAGLIAAGGDDYELCFTAAPARREAVLAAGAGAGIAVTRIGQIGAGSGLQLLDAAGNAITLEKGGYDHFA